MDYTKYRLKPEKEIAGLLERVKKVHLLHCQKCFKLYDVQTEPESSEIIAGFAASPVEITGFSSIDFLCSSPDTGKIIRRLEDDPAALGVISCGLGVQTAAAVIPGKTVIALADSLPHGKNATPARTLHGISLDGQFCSACGECYLDITGGICPVSNCAKSLLNGPCGGASGGKCEVDKNRSCAWEDIYNRLKKQGRSFSLKIHTRDFTLLAGSEIIKMGAANRSARDEGFPGGVHPPGRKSPAETSPLAEFPEPAYAAVFLSQHTGIPAKPLVEPGDKVKRGMKIGEAGGFISSSVHASISGRVLSIEDKFHPAFLRKMPAIVIENNGKSELDDSIAPLKNPMEASAEDVVKYLADKGIVGLGGAMFPSHVKLSPPKKTDTLILNGAECEPFLNADNRIMIEFPNRIISGMKLIMKLLNIQNGVIAVEDNKQEAISKLNGLAGGGIRTAALPSKYPQGSEKMLIKALLGRSVPDEGLPMDAGAVVFNVSTVLAVHKAVFEGMPLIERAITVSGDYPGEKANLIVKNGTPMANIITYCTGEAAARLMENFTVKMGGPMMGIAQTEPETYTVKGTTGFTIEEKPAVELSEKRECIKCGRCVEACPMGLEPLKYVYLAKNKKWGEFKHYRLSSCFECGACDYVCSAKISIVNLIKKAKSNVCVKT